MIKLLNTIFIALIGALVGALIAAFICAIGTVVVEATKVMFGYITSSPEIAGFVIVCAIIGAWVAALVYKNE